MRSAKRWPAAILLALAMVALGPFSVPGTTAFDVDIGESFTGTIATPGVDVVQAQFSAEFGTAIRVAVQALGGSTLVPTVVVRNGAGAVVSGSTQSIEWLPYNNVIHRVTIPAAGTYTVEVGGASGSGEFWARLTGTAGQVQLATVSGTVTDELTGNGIAGVEVYAGATLVATTDSMGNYSAQLAPGTYTLSFESPDYETGTTMVTLTAGAPAAADVLLMPVVPVSLETGLDGDGEPGGTVMPSVTVTQPAGSAAPTYSWTQLHGAPVTITGADTATPTVTLTSTSGFKDALIGILNEPPIGADELPPGVPVPSGEFPAGLQDRYQVVGLNPFALEEAALVTLEVEVGTQFGTFTEEVEVHVALPWEPATGLRTVPTGDPVLLHAAEQPSYDWMLFPPAGSLATLMDARTRNPWFIPDVPGRYELEVGTVTEGSGGATLVVFAGEWRGVIVDQDIDGNPVADTACTLCHDGVSAQDKFTPWSASGHAEIFEQNLNTGTHYGPQCFSCHMVGYDPDTDNGGADEASDYDEFLNSGLINAPGDNWTTVLEEYPETAQLANIQCESCHGPQIAQAHGFAAPQGDPRVSLSSDVCAVCHGEPLRHARFQQWQLSAHANYEVAIDEGTSGNCSRCHTGNGFLEWLPILLDDDPETDPLDNITVTWDPDETHPQTCATCHDPHAPGTTSGAGTNATVRVSGDTPPLIGGFQVMDAGKGAICMTCHNSRRGLRNDDTYPNLVGSDVVSAPHGSAQADVLTGHNAFLIDVPQPGGHAALLDACVTCHMRSTPPPDLLAYNEGGTNHTFYASPDVCADCHGPHLQAEDVQDSIEALVHEAADLLADSYLELIDDLIAAGNTIDLGGGTTLPADGPISSLSFSEFRGRQAIVGTLTGGATFGPIPLASVDVLDGSMMSVGALYEFADPVLHKAGWNILLVENDGSLGVHNPFFAMNALASARDAMLAVSPSLAGATASPVPPRGERAQPPWGDTRRDATRDVGRERSRTR